MEKKLFEFSIKMLLPRKGAQTLKRTAAETVNMLVFPRTAWWIDS